MKAPWGARMNRDGLAGIRLRFFLVAPLFAAVALFSTGCRKAAPSDATLVAAIPASPLTLDPRLASDAEGDKISSIICDGLVARSYAGYEPLDVLRTDIQLLLDGQPLPPKPPRKT